MVKTNRWFKVICWILVSIITVMTILPFIYILAVSFSSPDAVNSGKVTLYPIRFTLDSYIGFYKNAEVLRSLKNSIVLAVIGTLLNMVFSILCAYPLSRPELKGKKTIIYILLFIMFFRPSIIPSFLWMKYIGVTNTYWAIWLTKLIGVYNVLILKTFFQRIPENVISAARIDGASEWEILIKIVLPMSKSALVTIATFYFIGWWNEYYLSLVYISDTEKFTLPVRIIQMIRNVTESTTSFIDRDELSNLSVSGVRAAGIVISIIPILCLLPFLQKYYTKGIAISSFKDKK